MSSAPHRQVAALAGGFLDISKRARVVSAEQPMPVKPGSKLVASPDAAAADLAAAQRWVEGK
jgi:hypothetical protein